MKTSHRIASIALALGGLLYNAFGATHPTDGGRGNKVEQLHEMLVDPSWYASHLLGLLAVSGFAAGAWALQGRGSAHVQRVTHAVWIVGVIQVIAMIPHILTPLNADNIADGEANLWYYVPVVNETVVTSAWAAAFAVLAAVGGVTRTFGNTVTAALGLVGGGVTVLASTTIAFTDQFDLLFPVGGLLLGLWAVVMGVWYVAPANVLTRKVASASARG